MSNGIATAMHKEVKRVKTLQDYNRAVGHAQAVQQLSEHNPVTIDCGTWLSHSRTWLDANGWNITLNGLDAVIFSTNTKEE